MPIVWTLFEKGPFWPFWLGGLGLAVVAVLHARWLGRHLGVSGRIQALVEVREAIRNDLEWAEARENEAAFIQALLEASQKEAASQSEFGEPNTEFSEAGDQIPPSPNEFPGAASRSTWLMHLVFVLGVVLGGWLSSMLQPSTTTGSTIASDLAQRIGVWKEVLVLLGGALVGFGAQMGGGCTSGHGLVGCATLRLPSLIATITFVGAAVGSTFLIRWMIGG